MWDESSTLLQYGYGLYEFKGHAIFVSTHFIARVISKIKRKRNTREVCKDLDRFIDNPYHKLNDRSLQVLLKTFSGEIRTIYESDTDHEAIVRRYLRQHHSMKPGIEYKEIPCKNSDDGLKQFLTDEADIFIGGLNHTYYLEKGEEKDKARVIVQKGNLKIYRPVNGFITRKEFLNDRSQEFTLLVWLWFSIMKILRKAVKEFNQGEKRSEAIMLKIVSFINRESLGWLNGPEDLVEIYENYNDFYESPDESRNRILGKNPSWKSYWKLTKGRCEKQVDPQDVIPYDYIKNLANQIRAVI